MKKILKGIYNYICFITEFDFLNLMGTFSRILVYCLVFVDIFLRHKYFLGISCFVINLISSGLSIFRFRHFRNLKLKIDSPIIRSTQKKYKKDMKSKYKPKEYKTMTKEEKIVVVESFINVTTEVLDEAKKELEDLKGDNNEV